MIATSRPSIAGRLLNDFRGSRHIGLDMARAIAILSVLASHSRTFWGDPSQKFEDTLWVTFFGTFGVEIFFVISGYLIGSILFKVAEKSTSPAALGTFWFRRWMRTLPMYFAVLAFIFMKRDFFSASYLYFWQNVEYGAPKVFAVSWSLVVEEWFYLLTPIVLFSMAAIFGVRRGALLATVSIMVASIALRYAQYRGFDSLGAHWRTFTFRFDTLALGCLLAWVRVYRADWFDSLRRHHLAVSALAVALFASIFLYYQVPIFEWSVPRPRFLAFVIWPLWVGVASAVIVLAFSLRNFKLSRALSWPITLVSVTSYSTYLLHLEIFDFVWRYGTRGAGIQWAGVAVIASLAVAFATYLLVERPIMILRDLASAHQTQDRLGVDLDGKPTPATILVVPQRRIRPEQGEALGEDSPQRAA